MVRETELTELLVFDLETAPEYRSFSELLEQNPRKAELWKTKHDKAKEKEGDVSNPKWVNYEQSYMDHTALHPEFGRIVCASFLHIVTTIEDGKQLYKGRIKSFYDNAATESSEKTLVLEPVSKLLDNISKTNSSYKLCGHNIKRFDMPFLTKRLIMNDVPVPEHLQTWGKKPWELTAVDTGDLWSMGVWDQYVSLDLLACATGVPSPKENMKGEYVGKAFWEEKQYDKIYLYCEEDVKCVARVCHKLSGTILNLEF
jgi:predicted PolB exonuclease-like 3'-5' exonuclease